MSDYRSVGLSICRTIDRDPWEGEPILYDSGNREYYNSNKRLSALKRICEEMGDEISEVDIRYYIKKFRTQWCKENRKINTKKTGSGANEVCISNWKFFDSLYFLRDNSQPVKTITSISPDDDNDTCTGRDSDDMTEEREDREDRDELFDGKEERETFDSEKPQRSAKTFKGKGNTTRGNKNIISAADNV